MDESSDVTDGGMQWSHSKRRFHPKDEFFTDGDLACGFIEKQVVFENLIHDDVNHSRVSSFPCGISGCTEQFESISSYEHHYNSLHLHKCSVCKRSFPTNHLLSVHLLEWHDPMFDIQTAQHDMHQCLIESCHTKFKTAKLRRNHMIEVHKYPSNFRFEQAKKSTSSHQITNSDLVKMDVANKNLPVDISVDSEQTPPKRVFSYKVPPSVCFGKGTSKGFQHPKRTKKHWHQSNKMDTETTVNIEKIKMNDLADALVENQ